MNSQQAVLAIDQGTTSSRAIIFDSDAKIITSQQKEFPQHFPKPGWVEHDPEDLWRSTLETARSALRNAETAGYQVVAIGLTNQRETTVVWDRSTGEAIYPALVWQDRRTAEVCARMRSEGLEPSVQEKTGLLLDPYFSATKIGWILDHVPGARRRGENGELAFGTVDSYLIYRLSGGAKHVTDATNASRTSLFSLQSSDWDEELLRLFNIPRALLPEVLDCSANFATTESSLFGRPLPILGVAGDQQAAAIGQCCFEPGQTKSTYGTGCFVLTNTGSDIVRSEHRLLTTLAFRLKGKPCFALEGSVFMAGAAVQWLRDQLEFVKTASDTEALAMSVEDSGGVFLVPAFTGLGAPHWNPEARGALFGLTRSTGRAHIVRATIESVVYQTFDLLEAMRSDGAGPSHLRIDGGMAQNNLFAQLLADILDLPIDRPRVVETTALGAAYLAGSQAGIYGSLREIASGWEIDRRFTPDLQADQRQMRLAGWKEAVRKLLS